MASTHEPVSEEEAEPVPEGEPDGSASLPEIILPPFSLITVIVFG